ncbi:hypothetical protein ACFLYA_01790 [Candidatus Dependentiae bacterium]
MKKNIGIVLKKYHPFKKTISILDKILGKINCIPKSQDLALGSLISYTIAKKKHLYFLENMEILDIPFKAAISDIVFFHHVLELCDHFIPIECPSRNIFILVQNLYFSANMIQYNSDRKLFLFKLLVVLGMYPEDAKFQTPYLHNLATKSIDTIISKNLHLEGEKEIDSWLHCCIAMQPEFSNFKTIKYLYKNK